MTALGSSEIRKGRYHRSNFWDIKGFGKDRWVVGVYIEFNADDVPPWMSNQEVAEGCIEYLNQPPERKKYEKRSSHSLYGKLALYEHWLKKAENGEPYIEAMLITDEPKNKNFWGKGKSDKF